MVIFIGLSYTMFQTVRLSKRYLHFDTSSFLRLLGVQLQPIACFQRSRVSM